LHLLGEKAKLKFLKRDFSGCEKWQLIANDLSDKLTNSNVENRFLNHHRLGVLYLYQNVDMAHDFSDGEISMILDAKKDYN
jgi:hypothetical protein